MPQCGSCIRARTACSGYRRTEDLRIEDESRKFLKATGSTTQDAPRLKSLMPALEVRARENFFAHFVVGALGTYDFLAVYCSQARIDQQLDVSVDAVSLAFLSVQSRSDVVAAEARVKYALATGHTRRALSCSEHATTDSTFLATLMLDLYEKLTHVKSTLSPAWFNHVRGTLTLVRMRGEDQFRNAVLLKILTNYTTKLLISCVVMRISIPQEVVSLRAHIAQVKKYTTPKWQQTDVIVRYANLRADKSQGLVDSVQVVTKATEIEFLLAHLENPSHWLYKTVFTTCSSLGAFQDYYHVYASEHVTQSWNVRRSIRILLNEIILANEICGDPLDTPLHGSLLLRQAGICQLAAEICATIIQYVEVLHEMECSPASVPTTSIGPVTTRVMQALAELGTSPPSSRTQWIDLLRVQCYTLIFSMYVAARSRYTPGHQRSWIIHKLYMMDAKLGIRNAAFVAHLLQSQLDHEAPIDPFEVYAMLGGYAFMA